MNNVTMVTNYIMGVQLGGVGKKWTTLIHNGVLFPPEYVQHFTPIIYQGTEIILEKDAEEIATLYARYTDTDYTKSKIFKKNFWADWKVILGKNHTIQSLEDCDFSLIFNYILKQKEEKKLLGPDLTKKEEEEKYKYAIVDGIVQSVGNFRIEPPGIFLGRGCNPKLGRVKHRIYPEDVIINIGTEAPVPEPIQNHHWKSVIHDKTVEWLASWADPINTHKNKYVWLAATANLKVKNDISKFDLARKLKKRIKTIRKENEKLLTNTDLQTKQIATALYFIDYLALRVGNEKSKGETDTVGVTSLRLEHIKLLGDSKIKLDFLGKDSVRYVNTVTVNPQIYKNIEEFATGKNPTDNLFDLINPTDVNKYLQNYMKNLTAKVFRTYNASHLFQKELGKISTKYDNYETADKINLMLDDFNKANAKIAILCNHQKNITKSSNNQIEKINTTIKTLQDKLKKAKKDKVSPAKIKKMQSYIKKLKAKKSLKIELKNISLGTSKINYIDPRISVAFIKKHNLPIDKIFSKTLQEKFSWAMTTNADFVF